MVENLEWATESENQNHANFILEKRIGEKYWNSKLTEQEVIEIYNLCAENKMLRKDIAQLYNTRTETIKSIVIGQSWKYLNLKPLPPSIKGCKKKGTRYSRRRYKLIDTITNEELIFNKAKDIANIIGISDNMVRKYATDDYYKDKLIKNKYLIESLEWIYK